MITVSIPTEGHPVPKNMPLWSLLSAVLLVITLGVVILVTPVDKLSASQTGIFIALIVSSVPSLLAAAYAERTSRDVRNGTVVEKAREGAVMAIQETEVLTQSGPVATASLETSAAATVALTELLKRSEIHTPAPQRLVSPTDELENDNGR